MCPCMEKILKIDIGHLGKCEVQAMLQVCLYSPETNPAAV